MQQHLILHLGTFDLQMPGSFIELQVPDIMIFVCDWMVSCVTVRVDVLEALFLSRLADHHGSCGPRRLKAL